VVTDRNGFVYLITDSKNYQSIRQPQTTQERTLKVYPNPARRSVTVENKKWQESSFITLLDITGKKIRAYSVSGFQTKINVSDLQAGIYLLKTGTQMTKIVVGD
jgi:hypothetical protein